MLDSPPAFFRRQTVFITGATGSLDGCLLFKLVLKLDVDKIYILVRGSAVRAEAHWIETMPDHIGPILRTRKILFVEGEMTESDFGIAPSILAEMASVVTLIIHAAANIHLKHSLEKTVRNNCLSSLELARMALKFKCLSAFVHVSSAYCNSFLPDGIVEEKIYVFGNPDAEKQLSEILDTGFPSEGDVSLFTSPYALGKHLTERLLSSRFPHLPLLIIRPTIIGPAIFEPYPYYGPSGSCPLSTYIRTYMESPDSGVIHISPTNASGFNIVDEIPVDLVANIILLHMVKGTNGIVHAGAESYTPRRLCDLLADICTHMPPALWPQCTPFSYVSDGRIPEGRYAKFWRFLGRDWRFSNAKSRNLKEMKGVLDLEFQGHAVAEFMAGRAGRMADVVLSSNKAAKL